MKGTHISILKLNTQHENKGESYIAIGRLLPMAIFTVQNIVN